MTPSIGDHLKSTRGLYDHHGIYVGGEQVIHYAGDRAKELATAKVRLSSLAEFCDGHPFEIVPYGVDVPPMDVVIRAFALLGESRYNVVFRNCEHLATLAKVGVAFSDQVNRALATVGTPMLAQVGAVFLAGGSAVHVAGAAKTMQALTAAGRLVGGGPLEGIAVSGAAVGAFSMLALHAAYRDDPFATALEREARAQARRSAWIGIGIGAVAVTLAVALVGRGSGAVRISTGLKSIGDVVGMGMAAGATICVGAPVAAAAVAAKNSYNRVRLVPTAPTASPPVSKS